jgi:excisionase family DNA binding protein
MPGELPSRLEPGRRRVSTIATLDPRRQRLGALASLLAPIAGASRAGIEFRILGADGESVELPDDVVVLLQQLTASLVEGDDVAVVPISREVTTQQAASLLNVSRQYLVRLLDQGHMPYRRSGTHRRIRVADVLAYKEKRDARLDALDQLSQLTQDLVGYDELTKPTLS